MPVPGLAVYAAREFGCRVTTTTISREQYDLARQRIRQHGLDRRVTVLEQDYRQLQTETAHREIAGQIESRFATLEKHRQIKAEYEEFLRLTTETSRRDAELLSLQKNTQNQPTVVVPNVPSGSPPAIGNFFSLTASA